MHIPDGLLSAPVAVACAGLSAVAVAMASTSARASMKEGPRAVARVGLTAAFVFAAQMLNFPVAGGTSGHLVGGVLAAVLVGPSAAVVVMTAVLAMQCLVFGDGGLLALGANALNMAVVHPLVGFAIYRLMAGRSGPQSARRIGSLAFAAWAATVLAAATCAGELALSRVVQAGVVLPAMVGVHAAIGAGEAVISALVFAAVMRLQPAQGRPAARVGRTTSGVVLGLVAALALALFVSPFACTWPDGLERVVEHLGIEPAQARLSLPAPLGGYSIPGLRGVAATSMAGAAGTVLVFAVCIGLGWCLAPRRPPPGDARATTSSRS